MSDEDTSTAGLGDLAKRVGDDVSDLVEQEVGTAKRELAATAKEGAAGVGLVSGGAVAGAMALLFGSIAVWRGLGDRIGLGRSAAVLALAYGGAAAVLSSGGAARLATVTGAPKTVRSLKDVASRVRSRS